MIVADGPDIYGYTIFCDDIRVEVGGKLTYVGAYLQTMSVQGTFPFVLPKFAMHFFYFQRRPNIVPPPRFIVITPGTTEDNPPIVINLPEIDVTQLIANADAAAGADSSTDNRVKFAVFGGPVSLTNFVINEPGEIKVRAVRGDEFVRLGSLQVRQDPNFAPSQAASSAT